MPPDGVTYGLAWIDAVIMVLLALLITGLVLSYLSEGKEKKEEEQAEQPAATKPEHPRRAA